MEKIKVIEVTLEMFGVFEKFIYREEVKKYKDQYQNSNNYYDPIEKTRHSYEGLVYKITLNAL